ncbi:TonB-linked SusC/RagA family outer membrane protein [Chitinophaga niastensis]|uniref:TonB-linked SusC/RagA family outer membrane protein n=1 Tax=Chitinophaga niastensis TaxID=536980 RepID=A0A2P8HKA4_CHINA|nr:SusC/RagA family TonB-linked outer membrane protein [Chitinophaga niastensis]PSL46641.1 TonB-linked SusC/RagA family outer membrane protein [Chitinophaga niastensis]
MKKTTIQADFVLPRYARKLLRMFKFTGILLLIFFQTSAAGYSQNNLSISFVKTDIEKVFHYLEKKSGYTFYYSNNEVENLPKLSIKMEKAAMRDILDEVSHLTGLHYAIMENNMIVFKKSVNEIQAKKINGKVSDEKGMPLPNITVQVKGTTTGTLTAVDGLFSLQVPDNAVLVFSGIGFLKQEIPVAGQTLLTVTMKEDVAGLNEVVVVGYGTQEKHKLTSAVVTVSGADLNKRIATNPATLLQGQLPGLQVTQGSGEPGNENVQLRIRGISTFSGAGNDPLVIIDGLPGSLSVLNPNDIESVSVLKDAASAAIYGSRGANGVIVVKTKKGKGGAFSLTYGYNLGISQASKLPNIITNSAEYMQLSNEAHTNSGLAPLYNQQQIDLYQNATDRVKYPNHNWLNDIFHTAYTQNHYLNMSGGKESTTYSLGIGISTQPGVMIGFDYKKYTLDLGLSSRVNKRITIGTNVQMRYADRKYPENGASDMFLSALAQSPLYPASSDGKWIKKAYSNELGNKNPVAIVQEDVRTRTSDYYAQGNLSLDIDIIDGLKWENRAGMNYDNYKYNDFRPVVPTYYFSDMSPAGLLDDGTPGLTVGNSGNIYTVYYSQFTFKKKFGEHNVSALAGYQQEQNKADNLDASRTQFPTNLLRELNAGPEQGQANDGTSSKWAIRSFYGNANYDYKDKYLFGTSVRYDGTSRLPSNTRWGLFYSFSGAWRVSEESFLKNISWINDLKLRGSWGQLGNQNIGTYPYQPSLDGRSYAFGGTVTNGVAGSSLVDPSLTWETTRVLDFGINLTALNNKLTFTGDWFNKYTYDILRGSQVPLWLGLNAPTINNGAVRNKGFEFNVQYNDRIGKNFTWYVGANFQTYKNTLEKFGKREIGGHTIREEGHELDAYYMYVWDGIFQSADEIAKSPKQPVDATPGDLKIKDVNGDGVINDKDRTYVKGKYPSFQYAINLGASWKNFDISAQLYASQGQKIYVNGWGIEPFRQGSIPTTDWRNRWTPEHPSTTMPKIYVADGYQPVQNYASTYFLKDASFIRLRNLQLGYTLPKNLISRIGMKSLRVYFTADNLFTISKYPGLDPERVDEGRYVTYPQTKTYTFGAMVQF